MSKIRARSAELDERGASAVEYALLVALIAAVIVVAAMLFGQSILGTFTHTCETYRDANGASQTCDTR